MSLSVAAPQPRRPAPGDPVVHPSERLTCTRAACAEPPAPGRRQAGQALPRLAAGGARRRSPPAARATRRRSAAGWARRSTSPRRCRGARARSCCRPGSRWRGTRRTRRGCRAWWTAPGPRPLPPGPSGTIRMGDAVDRGRVGRHDDAHERRGHQPHADREPLGRDLPPEHGVGDDRRDQPEREPGHDRPEGGVEQEATVEEREERTGSGHGSSLSRWCGSSSPYDLLRTCASTTIEAGGNCPQRTRRGPVAAAPHQLGALRLQGAPHRMARDTPLLQGACPN